MPAPPTADEGRHSDIIIIFRLSFYIFLSYGEYSCTLPSKVPPLSIPEELSD